MKNVYANLLGVWVNLSKDDKCVMGPHMTSPTLWWEENAEIFSSNKREEDTMYQLDHIHIQYKGKDYRINPIFIQIVEG